MQLKKEKKQKLVEFLINDRFEEFIDNWEHRYYFLLGGYGSSKSFHTFVKIVKKLMEEPGRVCLVCRAYYSDLKESCFELIRDVINRMGLTKQVKCKLSPFEFIFKNGSRIIMKGADNKESLKSLHNASIVVLEEASQFKALSAKELDGRLRHFTHSNHLIYMTNPTSFNNYTFRKFFEYTKKNELTKEDELVVLCDHHQLYEQGTIINEETNTYYHHSTCADNAFLPDDYIESLNRLKETDPDEYMTARLGRFGAVGLRVLPTFTTATMTEIEKMMEKLDDEKMKKPKIRRFKGLDFGFQTSFNCCLKLAVDTQNDILYILDEYYRKGVDDPEIADDLEKFLGDDKGIIYADSAEPKTISYLNKRLLKYGHQFLKAKKFNGSVLANIKKVRRFKKIVCAKHCRNTIRELQDLTFKRDRDGNTIEDTFIIDAHSFDAIAYGLNDYEVIDYKQITNKSQLGL